MKQTNTLLKEINGNYSLLLGKISKLKLRHSIVIGIALFFLVNPLNSTAQVVNTQSFDGTTFVPTGWTNFVTSSSAVWTRATGGTSPTQAPHSGAGEAYFNSYSASSGVSALITPPYTLVNNTSGANVNFWMYRDAGYNTTADKVDVYYNTAPNLTGAVLLGTVNRASGLTPTVSIDGWYQYSYTIPNTVTSANVYLILNATSAWGDNIYIDDVSWTSYPNICSGTPSVPSVTSASMCPGGGPFNLTTTGATNALGISYQWQSSASSSGPFTSIAGATTTAYGSSTTTTTFYQMLTTCSVSGLTSTTSVTSFSINNPGPCVCTTYLSSNATSAGDEEIIGVIFGTLNNVSSCSSVGPGVGSIQNMYSNYAGFVNSPTVCPGAVVPFTVNVGTCGGYYTISLTIYIDLNQNGSFADAGEQLYVANGTIVSGNAVGSVTIPATALGGLTRMRIILSETSSAQASTGTYSWGETEDYCVTIVPPPLTLTSNSGSICPGVPFTTTISGASTYTINGGAGTLSGTSISLTPIVNTTYTISGTTSIGCISAGKNAPTATVSTLASPAITVAATSASICPGINTTLTATGANTYTWTSPSSSASFVTVNPSVTSVYTVSGTGTTVCNGVKTFTVFAYPAPTISVNSNTLCAGSIFTMVPTMVPGGAATYTYANGSNTISPTTNTAVNVTGTSTNGCIAPVAAVSSITVLTLPVVTVNSGTICNGSIFVMTPSGATTYTFVNTANPASPSVTTTYSVIGSTTVGCASLPALSTITVYALPVVSVAATPSTMVLCNNSVLSLTGSGALTYNWNNNATGTTFTSTPSSSASYFVIGTDVNGCTGSAVIPFTVNPSPVLALTGNTFVCLGNSSTLTATGTGVTYSWTSTGTASTTIVSPTVTTVYGVTGTNTLGCTSTKTLAVNVNTIVVTASSNTAMCMNGSANISATGANSYVWSPSGPPFNAITVSPLVTTTYTFVAIDSKACSHTGMITVTVNPLPVVTAIASSVAICSGETATITAGGASTYVWNDPANSTGGSLTVTPTNNTSYVVTGTDTKGCVSTGSVTLTVSKCTGISKVENEIVGLSVYPNPTSGEFTVELNNGLVKTIVVSDLSGRVILNTQTQNDKTVVNLNNFANGVYYVKIQSSTSVEILKVVKH